jgi:GNAT superfamily N-acetyltransferase
MQSLMDIRHVESLADVEESFCVMRELRPHLKDRGAYVVQIQHQRTQGYRLLAARSNGVIVGLAGYRQMDSLLYGRFVYVDDLVVTGSLHRSGFGERLLQAAREQALALKCDNFVLDTGLHMALAQRFYFRQGLLAQGMHFVEPLTQTQEKK